ncbi:MAG: hypothetical protein P9L92_07185 [Candidatus Electryonea clarkiae]|nr:hypothetical protein [Candidatus Electryonea clarkiae]MDP8285155.1 hypothetical protein [Candidatus Electryonea clarkiae]
MFEIKDFLYDEDILESARISGKPQVKVYPFPDKVVVLGRGSDPDEELHLENCENDGIPVLRRRGGGCSVVLDQGNIIVSVTSPAEGFGRIKEQYNIITDWLISALIATGLNETYSAGISDIAVGDRKIGGTSLYKPKDFIYFTASLLVAPDLNLMERYLKYPPREPDYRNGRSHRDFVETIGMLTGYKHPEKFAKALKTNLRLEKLLLT